MKKNILAACLLVSINSYAELPKANDTYLSCTEVSCSNYIVNKFNIHPSFFGGTYVYAEPVYASVEYKKEKLMFKPTSSVMVFNQTTSVLYRKNKDFVYHGSSITFPTDSAVPVAPAGFSKPLKEDKKFNVKVNTEYQNYQIPVSYKKNGHLNLKMSGSISDLRKLIKEEPDIKVTYYGDSITFGANATDIYSAPNQPPFVGLVSAYLSMFKGGGYHWYNPSVPGWNTNNAVSDNTGRMLKLDSNIYVISFGVNDSNDVTPKEFIKNIEFLIREIKNKNKNARIVLTSPIRPNPEWVLPKKEYFQGYSNGLKALSLKYEHTTFIDITDVWNQILKRKNIWAITGNGVNHPGDFGHRVIAEALLTTMLGRNFY
ncbi:SGNH/GDSL hydrolase family protein [Ewingella sp. S1.OA.A_B6]